MPVKYDEFTPDSIVQSIIEKFIDRAKMGKEKYGQTLDRSDLPFEDYINHALEEHMDAILYLKKAQQMFKEKDGR